MGRGKSIAIYGERKRETDRQTDRQIEKEKERQNDTMSENKTFSHIYTFPTSKFHPLIIILFYELTF